MFRMFLLMLLSLTSIIASAETESTHRTQGYVTDDLYIYLHSGPSTKYRILGSVYAGDNIVKLAESEDGEFIQIEDKKQRVGWIAKKYFNDEQSLKDKYNDAQTALTAQQAKLTSLQQHTEQLSSQLRTAQQETQSQHASLLEENQQLKADVALLLAERQKGAAAYRVHQNDMQNQRMIFGAGILLAGLIIGRIFSSFKRRSSFLE